MANEPSRVLTDVLVLTSKKVVPLIVNLRIGSIRKYPYIMVKVVTCSCTKTQPTIDWSVHRRASITLIYFSTPMLLVGMFRVTGLYTPRTQAQSFQIVRLSLAWLRMLLCQFAEKEPLAVNTDWPAGPMELDRAQMLPESGVDLSIFACDADAMRKTENGPWSWITTVKVNWRVNRFEEFCLRGSWAWMLDWIGLDWIRERTRWNDPISASYA